MKKIFSYLILLMIATAPTASLAADNNSGITAKHVRNFVKKGNEAYNAGNYAQAETFYRDAIQEDPTSSAALFNLALTLTRKNGNPLKSATTAQPAKEGEQKSDPKADAYSNPVSLFENVIALNRDEKLVRYSYYNLGNIYFEAEDYAKAIECYKDVLRRDPDHIKSRQNLRIAQLKLQEQQNQNKDQNKDQNQNQDQNKDQNQNQQDQQDQKDKKDQQNQNDKKDQDKDKQQEKSDNSQNPQNKNQNQNQGGTSSSGKQSMSKENSDKILESVRKQEEQTRKKVEKRKSNQTTRRMTDRPW